MSNMVFSNVHVVEYLVSV